jgi:UDP-N-acetylglucosamine:LPS N-acetylglucosamine transferase
MTAETNASRGFSITEPLPSVPSTNLEFPHGMSLIESYISDQLNLILEGRRAFGNHDGDHFLDNARTIITVGGSETFLQNSLPIGAMPAHSAVHRTHTQPTPMITIQSGAVTISFAAILTYVTQLILRLKEMFMSLFSNAKLQVRSNLSQILQDLKYHDMVTVQNEKRVLDLYDAAKSDELKNCIVKIAGSFNLSPQDQQKMINLVHKNEIIESFRFLHSTQILRNLIAKTEWQDILTADDRKKYTEAYTQFQVSGTLHDLYPILFDLSCRTQIRAWIKRIEQAFTSQESLKLVIPIFKQLQDHLKSNDALAFAKSAEELISNLKILCKPMGLKQAYLDELLSFFHGYSESKQDPAHLFAQFALQLAQEKYLKVWDERANTLLVLLQQENERELEHKKFYDLERVDQMIGASLNLFDQYGKLLESENREHVSGSHFSSQYGSLVGSWRKINNEFAKLAKRIQSTPKEHTHCNCHYAKKLDSTTRCKWNDLPERIQGIKSVANIPKSLHDKKEKTALYLFCSMGSGHRMTTDALIGYSQEDIEENKFKYHVRTVNVPLDVLLPFDAIHNTLGKIWDHMNADWLYNTLLQKDWCDILTFLKGLSSQEPSLEHRAQVKKLLREHILKENPDIIVLTYSFDHEYVEEVAEELGIPLIHTATDLDLSGRKKVPTHPAYKFLIPAKHPRMMQTLGVGTVIKEEQYEAVGPIVRKAFLPKTAEEIKKLKNEMGIAENEEVVVVTSGGNGVPSRLPEILAKNWDEDYPLRVIVICGKNNEFAESLEQNVVPFKKDNVNLTIYKGFIEDQYEMAKPSHVAGLIHGKTGGITTLEAISTGTPFLGDQLRYRFSWEKINNDVLIDIDQGDKIDSKDSDQEILSKVKELLKKGKVFHPDFHLAEPASAKVARIMSDLIATSEENNYLQEHKKNWSPDALDLAKMNIAR